MPGPALVGAGVLGEHFAAIAETAGAARSRRRAREAGALRPVAVVRATLGAALVPGQEQALDHSGGRQHAAGSVRRVGRRTAACDTFREWASPGASLVGAGVGAEFRAGAVGEAATAPDGTAGPWGTRGVLAQPGAALVRADRGGADDVAGVADAAGSGGERRGSRHEQGDGDDDDDDESEATRTGLERSSRRSTGCEHGNPCGARGERPMA